MLRRALLLAAVLLLVAGGVIFLGAFFLWPLALDWIVGGTVLVAAILFERSRYRPAIDRSAAGWQATGERFIDPTSGKLLEVRYNPQTGERDYVEVIFSATGRPQGRGRASQKMQ
ncbi:MAG: hypothetical protein ACYDA5_05480 [Vulcanimicrobiaceae bacterium]